MSIDNFIKILQDRCRFMNAISEAGSNNSRSKSNHQDKSMRTMVATSLKCSGCLQASHQRDNFLSLTPEKRYDLIKQQKLCINCLSINHIWQKCTSKFNCCGKRMGNVGNVITNCYIEMRKSLLQTQMPIQIRRKLQTKLRMQNRQQW